MQFNFTTTVVLSDDEYNEAILIETFSFAETTLQESYFLTAPWKFIQMLTYFLK